MTTKKKIKIALLSIIGTAVLLFLVLIIHVAYMVHKRGPMPNATLQLARVEFLQPVDANAAANIQTKVMREKGVKNTYFNVKAKLLIYGFDNRMNNSQAIYDAAIKNCGVASARDIVPASQMSSGCPAMGGNSFYAKLTNTIYNIEY